MGFFDSPNPEVKELKGLHLYHFFLSNCSQRVRMALEEKRLAWTSHHVNLVANEHATEWYQTLNPNGVVPTLVHDGQVIIESNDIIRYLDEAFPESSLSPDGEAARQRMGELIDAASGIQSAIKVISHDRLFRRFRQLSAEEVEAFAASHHNRSLIEFMRDYSEDGTVWEARVEVAEREMGDALARLELVLGAQAWLSGDACGLADISWIVNGHRLQQAEFPLGPFPRVAEWCERVKARPAFDRAIARYRPE